MRLHNLDNRQKEGYTTWGCIWEKGQCWKDTEYELYNDDRSLVPMQSRIIAWWPDGSVKWTAHTANSGKMSDVVEVVPILQPIGQNSQITIEKNENISIKTGSMTLDIPAAPGEVLFRQISVGGRTVLKEARSVLILERPFESDETAGVERREYHSFIKRTDLVEMGPVCAVVRYEGCHRDKRGDEKFPFIIYMKIGAEGNKINFTHTFFYDGEEDEDYLKGLGILVDIPMRGPVYNRHVKIQGDHGCFHEAAAELLGGKGLPWSVYESQMRGECLTLSGGELSEALKMAMEIPVWSEYEVCQDSDSHFSIRKKIGDKNCCFLNCLNGERTEGGAAIGSENGSVVFSLRDFRERYPSGYTFSRLEEETAQAAIWLWPPKAEAMDFRHYANRGYSRYYYEGYDWKGATPYGIACTSEFSMEVRPEMIPSDEAIATFSRLVKNPPQYVGEPEYYHHRKAFGRWSLKCEETAAEAWLEKQLEQAAEFYKREVEQRRWYGMFDYGDFMHTYDKDRHVWRYDMGGFAWDNTELVPTLWLWIMFMRTGREDIFTLAEKLTRHTSEVDVYHLGPNKGLGSRHNVRHWGCPCKEVRISMAAHHRYYYYLTGDYRLGDLFEEMKDSENVLLERDPLAAFYDEKEKQMPTHARTGPDWSSLCANWLTRWERFGDNRYKQKIVTGIRDIAKAPLKLVSGPDFEFDPESHHLRYIGECATGGTHLQICMGAPEIWIELSELLEDSEWIRMLADYGRFYYLDPEEQQKESGGIIGSRAFTLPYMAGTMGAFGAAYFDDKLLAKKTWSCLLEAIPKTSFGTGFQPVVCEECGNRERLLEIPWISTNFTAQWCLNVIMALEFIREELPAKLDF